MITLIGHGYIGDSISEKLTTENIQFNWISHDNQIPANTTVIINAAGYTGYPNVDKLMAVYPLQSIKTVLQRVIDHFKD